MKWTVSIVVGMKCIHTIQWLRTGGVLLGCRGIRDRCQGSGGADLVVPGQRVSLDQAFTTTLVNHKGHLDQQSSNALCKWSGLDGRGEAGGGQTLILSPHHPSTSSLSSPPTHQPTHPHHLPIAIPQFSHKTRPSTSHVPQRRRPRSL
jgi:hypothetical protein